MRIFYPLVNASIHSTSLLGFVLNTRSKAYMIGGFIILLRICYRFTVRSHGIYLNYVGTLK